ncbi:MAG: phospholipase D-like domain-containing protein [Nannocystaceae bacterium]|nr:phospholipase D-like domain-containing protein [bacterium]
MGFIEQIPRWVLELGFVAYAVVVSVVVLLERRRPTATLALLLSLLFLPVVGLIAYVVFSRRKVRRKRKDRRRREIDPLAATEGMANVDELPEGLPEDQRGLVRLALRSTAAPLRRAARVDLLHTADATRESVLSAIRGATRCVHAEFYIWRDDDAGRAITAALTERARAGVQVRVLIDQLGSWGLERDHFEALIAAGGELAIFGPVRVPIRLGRSRVNFRNHRKIITVDGGIGFVGGLNVGDEYFGSGADAQGWRDLFVRLEGDAVLGLEATFLDDWLVTTGHVVDLEGKRPEGTHALDARVRRSQTAPREALQRANPFTPEDAPPQRSDGPLVQVIPSGPDLPVAGAIAAQFSAAIAAAHQRAYIATPYFIPDEPLMLILRTAALRGVDVRILVPSPAFNDSRVVAYASRSYYDELLLAGCRIFEYRGGMLHSKYLIADDVSAIGSANMDVRSFHINYEITAMFYDADVTNDLAKVYEADLQQASEIRREDRLDPSLWEQLRENSARVFSPLL